MAMSATYTTFIGQIVKENRGGTESFYAPDTLGSTAALLSTTGSVTDTYDYWPFGEIRDHNGSSTTPFTYCGTLGYYLQVLSNFTYVRASWLRQALTRWQVVDPLWPKTLAYRYCDDAPIIYNDPSGLQVAPPNYLPSGPAPAFPITCGSGGGWSQWIWQYCNSCYYSPHPVWNCRSVCSYWANQYYQKCNAPSYPRLPGSPPFAPSKPGGPIVPSRTGPLPPLCPPAETPCDLCPAKNVTSDGYDLLACLQCCKTCSGWPVLVCMINCGTVSGTQAPIVWPGPGPEPVQPGPPPP